MIIAIYIITFIVTTIYLTVGPLRIIEEVNVRERHFKKTKGEVSLELYINMRIVLLVGCLFGVGALIQIQNIYLAFVPGVLLFVVYMIRSGFNWAIMRFEIAFLFLFWAVIESLMFVFLQMAKD